MTNSEAWYVVKQPDGHCQILPEAELDSGSAHEKWGPFSSQGEATARRVGLIRSGKCQPI
jgi:hypothetical protein